MPKPLILSVAMIALYCGGASADWQYTRWNQPLSELLAATDKGVRETPASDVDIKSNTNIGRALAIAPYSVAGIPTEARFMFDSDKLRGVNLSFGSSEDGFRARRLLQEQYGPPLESKVLDGGCRMQRDVWRLEDQGNNITFDALECEITGSSVISILYTPIQTSSETGL